MSEEEKIENVDSTRDDHVTGDVAEKKQDANIETHKQPNENKELQDDGCTANSVLKAEPSEKCFSQKLQSDSEACNLDYSQTTETKKEETELHDNVQTIDDEIRRMNLSEGKEEEEEVSAQARVQIQPPPPPPEKHLSSGPNLLCADSVDHKNGSTKTGHKDSQSRITVGRFTDYDVISKKEVQHFSEWENIHKDCLSEIPPIDPGALLDIERKAKEVAGNLDHLLHTLNNSLKSMSVTGVQSVDTYKTTVENMEATVDASIKSMYTLITKCNELHSYMGPLYSMSAQIKDIKRTLDVFESLCK